MNRNRLLTALISLLVIFVIAGCSNNQGASQNSATSNGSEKTAGANTNGFGKPDIYGEVSKIDGNNVTLKMMKIPTMPARNGQNNGKGQNSSNNGNFGNRCNGGFRGGMRVKKYTGKEKTIAIPADATLVTITRGANGIAENNITLKDVTIGSTLSVYYKEDGKTIDIIRVMQPRTGNGQDTNSSN